MTKSEARRYRLQIEKAASTMTDADALEAVELFPMWKNEATYAIGDRVRYIDKLYKCNIAHESQADWTPDVAVSLWSEVADEWAEWKQPQGAHDAYNTGDKCSYNGKHYICTIDNNAYAPDVYGWEAI